MDQLPITIAPDARFELRFRSLFHEGRAMAFPCDERGRVDLDHMNAALRTNYLFARTMVGRDFALPCVVARPLH